MKIYIDEDLPESCSKCRFLVHCDACVGHENYCPLIGSSIGYDLADDLADCVSVTPSWERHEDCPLEQRPHGEWKEVCDFDGNHYKWKCSVCGRLEEFEEDFCNCGADMRKEGGDS